MPMMEVRCCCQPQKLLGWLPVESQKWRADIRVDFPLPVEARFQAIGDVKIEKHQPVILCVANFYDASTRESHLALKSEDTPIETLRKLRGFKEAPADDRPRLYLDGQEIWPW